MTTYKNPLLKEAAQNETKPERKLWVNLGVETTNANGDDIFVSIPLAISADTLAERVESHCKATSNSSQEYKEIVQLQRMLSTALLDSFEELEEGETLNLSESEGVLSKVRIQLRKAGKAAEVDIDESSNSLLANIK